MFCFVCLSECSICSNPEQSRPRLSIATSMHAVLQPMAGQVILREPSILQHHQIPSGGRPGTKPSDSTQPPFHRQRTPIIATRCTCLIPPIPRHRTQPSACRCDRPYPVHVITLGARCIATKPPSQPDLSACFSAHDFASLAEALSRTLTLRLDSRSIAEYRLMLELKIG